MTSAVVEALARKQAAKLGIDLRDQSQRVRVEIESKSMLAECGQLITAGRGVYELFPEDIERLEKLVDRVSDVDRRAIEATRESMAARGEPDSYEAAYHAFYRAKIDRGEVCASAPPIVSMRRLDAPAKGKG